MQRRRQKNVAYMRLRISAELKEEIKMDKDIIVLSGHAVEDTQKLADALVRKFQLEFFNVDGRLVQLVDGKIPDVNATTLSQIIGQHFSTIRLVRSGDRWESELCPIEIDPRGLNDLINALLLRLGKVSQTKKLSEQIKSEIRYRVRTGEPKSAVSKAYGVPLDVVNSLSRAA